MERCKERAQISVIMGIYNCEKTLQEAVESIQNQTYTNWELIMCDDGSSDNTYQLAVDLSVLDPRIKVIKNEKNVGLNETLNRCLALARGSYIARMDGDDICDPERFKAEIEVLDHEHEISIVSTDMKFFNENGITGEISNPEYPDKMDFLRGRLFCHAPCMVRREAYITVGGYSVDSKLLRVEDYHLWLKMYKAGFKGKNIHKALYSMRDDGDAYKRRKFKYRINEAYVRCLAIRYLKLPIWGYIFVFRPIIVGLLPGFLYDILHKKNLNKSKK